MVLITGRATALRFAKAYPVVLLARKAETYNDTVAEINSAGGRALGIATDAADPASVKAAFDKIKTEFPDHKLAAAVYNVSAGYSRKPFLEQSVEDFDASVEGNA